MNRDIVQSRGRGLQKSHLRRYNSGKITRVNPGVRRIKPRLNVKPSRITKTFSKTIVTTPSISKPKLIGKYRWGNILKRSGKTPLEIAGKLKRDMKSKNIKLLPGEEVIKPIAFIRNGPMSVMGEVVSVDESTGNKGTIPMEFRASGASTIEWLFEMRDKGERVIVKLDEYGMPEYFRAYAPIIPADYADISYGLNLTRLDKNKFLAYAEINGKKYRRIFDSYDDYIKTEEANEKDGLDIFSRRINPQTNLLEFKK